MFPQATPFLAVTDQAWFDYLATLARSETLDEVNFWSPRSLHPMKAMAPATPVFFRLKAPRNAIAGYGFFASFAVLSLDEAWQTFGEKNGDPDPLRFLGRIGGYRGVDLHDPATVRAKLGCTILRRARFWPQERWIPWGQDRGWHRNIVQGKTEADAARASMLVSQIEFDHIVEPEEFAPRFELVDADGRAFVLARSVRREGQGSFRTRIVSAYGQCAITGEHTHPVLEAAHIQPYLGPRSNHLQNGLLLTKEFHALFDQGYVGVTPDYEIRISERLRTDWKNGRRYYPYDRQRLAQLPTAAELNPSRDALAWHLEHVFKRAG
jgi:putative restriction endonuclease